MDSKYIMIKVSLLLILNVDLGLRGPLISVCTVALQASKIGQNRICTP
jgi:hypothetical protein